MESKVAALPREKLESLTLQAVDRARKEYETVQSLAENLDSLRSADAIIVAQLESIEQERVQLQARKAQCEEETETTRSALEDFRRDDAPIPRVSETEDDYSAVAQRLGMVENQLTSELELAKQYMQDFKREQDARVDTSIVEKVQQEIEYAKQLEAILEEKASLHVPERAPETVPVVCDADVDAVHSELAMVIDHIQEMQADMCDAAEAHQPVLHVRQEELAFIFREHQELEGKQQEAFDAQTQAAKQQEDLTRYQSQLEEEHTRERALVEKLDTLQSECEKAATEVNRLREDNSVKLKEIQSAHELQRIKEVDQMSLLQEQADACMLATERLDSIQAETRLKMLDMQNKADERLGGLQQKIDSLRRECEENTQKMSEKDALRASAEEMKQKYEQVMQQASTKIQNFEAQSHQLSQQLKTKQEELLTLQGKYKTNARAKAVLSVEEDGKMWVCTGEHWYETSDRVDTIQMQAETVRQRAELDLEQLTHKVEQCTRERMRVEEDLDAYKQRALFAEESQVKQHSELRQAESSVTDMEDRLNALLLDVKAEQGKTSDMNQRLRDRRMEYGQHSESAMDIDVEIRSLEGKRQALHEQLRMKEKFARAALSVTSEKNEKEFQARLRDLELDLQLQTGLIPRLRAVLEELENVGEPSPRDSPVGLTPEAHTPRNELTTPCEVASDNAVEEEAQSEHTTDAPATSHGWNELMKHRELLRKCEEECREEELQLKQIEMEVSKTLSAIRTIKEKNTLEGNLQQPMQLEYIRNIFTKFLDASPIGSSEHEQLLRVVMTFFHFSPQELRDIEEKRQAKHSTWSLPSFVRK